MEWRTKPRRAACGALLATVLGIAGCERRGASALEPARQGDTHAAARVLAAHVLTELRDHYAPRALKESHGWSLAAQERALRAVASGVGCYT